MKSQKAALRYAKSLFTLAQEKNILDNVLADATLIVKTINENKDLSILLHTPLVKESKKAEILYLVFQGKVTDLSKDFIGLLTQNKREAILLEIFESFNSLYRAHKGIQKVHLTSAVAIDAQLKEEISKKLKLSQEQLEWEESIDASILGGFILRMGDQQINASVSHSLQSLKQELTNA